MPLEGTFGRDRFQSEIMFSQEVFGQGKFRSEISFSQGELFGQGMDNQS